jgi:hypothetical protein
MRTRDDSLCRRSGGGRISTGPVGSGGEELKSKEPLETVLKNGPFCRCLGQGNSKGVLQKRSLPITDNLDRADGVKDFGNGNADTGSRGGDNKTFNNPFHLKALLIAYLSLLYRFSRHKGDFFRHDGDIIFELDKNIEGFLDEGRIQDFGVQDHEHLGPIDGFANGGNIFQVQFAHILNKIVKLVGKLLRNIRDAAADDLPLQGRLGKGYVQVEATTLEGLA